MPVQVPVQLVDVPVLLSGPLFCPPMMLLDVLSSTVNVCAVVGKVPVPVVEKMAIFEQLMGMKVPRYVTPG